MMIQLIVKQMLLTKQSFKVTIITMMLSAGAVSAFTLERKPVETTRTYSRTSTVVYEGEQRSEVHYDNANRRSWSLLPWQQNQQHNSKVSRGRINISDEDEAAVDEYLEFLDRRYRRLHDYEGIKPSETTTSTQSKPGFSVVKWLKQETQSSSSEDNNDNAVQKTTSTNINNQDDVLYVLGVAGLASKKLLQKHQIPFGKVVNNELKPASGFTPDKNTKIIDVPMEASVVASDPATRSSSSVPLAASTSKLFGHVSRTRKSLHKLQMDAIKKVGKTTLKAPIVIAKNLWELGGGKHNIACTMTIAVALTFFIARPVVQFIASEGLNMTRGA